jgi:hypothetical protein
MEKPIPDGYYTLVLKDRHWPEPQFSDNRKPPFVKLLMQDYKWFRHEDEGFKGKHVDGRIELYMYHNILYIECTPNSEDYRAALELYREQCEHVWKMQAEGYDVLGVKWTHEHCINGCGSVRNDGEIVEGGLSCNEEVAQ